MAISASSIASSSTLNELRTQFNNLVTDVTAIEGGAISYTTLNTTTTNATTLNVKEDGTIVFEGATDDAYETTLTVVDPTADRTITFPNETGTVHTSGGTTTHTNIIIGDAGNIGSASDTNAIAIGADGDVTLTQDLELQHDGAILSFGADDDTTLTHTDGSGLTLNSTNKLMFNDASQFIQGASATVLDIAATDEIELTATLIDVVGNLAASGTYTGGGLMTTGGNIVIPDAGNIGSASDTDAIAIGSDGDVTLTQDLELQHDGAILSFGTNDEIALTHVHNTGLLLTDSGGTPTLQLHDANESVSSDGSKLILTSNGTAFNLPTSDGTSGQALITDGSGTFSFTTVSANTPSSADGQALGSASLEWSDLFLADGGTIQFGNDQEITITHVADTGLTLTHTASGDDKPIVLNLKSEEDDLASGEEIGRIDFTAGDSGGTDAIATAASIAAVAEDTFAADNNSTGLAFKLGVSAAATEMFRMDHDGDFKVLTDGSAIAFGANNEIELTHVHDTGLLLTDSGGSPTLQFHDSNEAVSSDGSKLILTSGGTAFSLPTSDGSSGQFLKTNGSAVLSFDTVSNAADDITAGDAAINITTSSGNITIDAAANDSDVIIKGTDNTADITMATFDGSDAGTLILNHDLELGTDASLIKFGADNEITLTHVHDTGLLLADSGGTPTLQFHDANESVSSDGGHLIFTSNGVAFDFPSADGSNGQVLQTNGSGVLSFADSGSSVAFNNFEYTATAAQTSFSGSDDNSNTLAYTAGVNSVQVLVNGIMLDSSDYTATNGTAVVLSSGASVNDMVKIVAVQSTNVASADLDGAEFVLDADGDTSLRANTDDQIDVKIGNAIDFAFKANSFEVATGSIIDMNGTELVLDADGDTSITADTDDQIDVRIAGADDFQFTANKFTVSSGSEANFPSGSKITGPGYVGKTMVLAMIFGS